MGRPDDPLSPRLVLDAGAVIALERNDRRAYAQLVAASRRGYLLVVPALVLMEAYASARSVERLNQVMKAIDVELPLRPETARRIPFLRRKAGVTSDADVQVVLEALDAPGSHVLTGDVEDILAVVAACGATGRVPVHRV